MNKGGWFACDEPQRMIKWLEAQGYGELLWDFTTACCRRIWEDLPSESFRRIIEHFETVGLRGIEDILFVAAGEVDKMERRLRRSSNILEETKLNRQIGFGNLVLAAFEQQEGASSAFSVSHDLMEWAGDKEAEARWQADYLRRLVPDASLKIPPNEF